MTVHIRTGRPADIEGLVALDEVTRRDPGRIAFIEEAVHAGNCFVAVAAGGERLAGYGVLTYHFYGNGMIEMLYVARDCRRAGVGRALLAYAEARCRTAKIFTSTNLSNKPMQLLLEKSGYVPSGYIDNLDPGDPELVYFKRLRDD